jgi:hypothetical protein
VPAAAEVVTADPTPDVARMAPADPPFGSDDGSRTSQAAFAARSVATADSRPASPRLSEPEVDTPLTTSVPDSTHQNAAAAARTGDG